MPARRAPSLLALPVALGLLLGACGDGASVPETEADGPAPPGAPAAGDGPEALDPSDWDAVLSAAQGQTVDWWMFGGDDRLNGYVNGYVAEKMRTLGVTLRQVKVSDTAEAVNAVLAELQAGRDRGGSVDLVWVNGENFATLKSADGWLCGWPSQIPAASNVDLEDPAVASDFGTPVDDCEAAWNRAQSVVVVDPERVPEDATADLDAFEQHVSDNPGLFTYPAPPDFTGSMVVRTFFYDVAQDAGRTDALSGAFDQEVFDELAPVLWERLNALEPSLYRGDSYPTAGPDVETLFADGEIGAYVTYDSGSLGGKVDDGVLPGTTRSRTLASGMIGNTNFVGIPANAGDAAGAMVLADVLQSVEAQYLKQTEGPGYYPAIDPELAGAAERFDAIETPESQLPFADQVENTLPELQAEWLAALEDGWVENVLQR